MTQALLSSGWCCPDALAPLVSDYVSHVPRTGWVISYVKDEPQKWKYSVCFDWRGAKGAWLRDALRIHDVQELISGFSIPWRRARRIENHSPAATLHMARLPGLYGYPVCDCTNMLGR